MVPSLEERIGALMLHACGHSDSNTTRLIAALVYSERAAAIETALGAVSNTLDENTPWYPYVHGRLLHVAAIDRARALEAP